MRRGTRVTVKTEDRAYWEGLGCGWLFTSPLEIKCRDREPYCSDRFWVGPVGVPMHGMAVSLHESLLEKVAKVAK